MSQNQSIAGGRSVPVYKCSDTLDPCRATIVDDGTLVLHVCAEEAMRFCPNGDILVQGRLAANDAEVVANMRAFLEPYGKLRAQQDGST